MCIKQQSGPNAQNFFPEQQNKSDSKFTDIINISTE
jgi:hypothetical protein